MLHSGSLFFLCRSHFHLNKLNHCHMQSVAHWHLSCSGRNLKSRHKLNFIWTRIHMPHSIPFNSISSGDLSPYRGCRVFRQWLLFILLLPSPAFLCAGCLRQLGETQTFRAAAARSVGLIKIKPSF